MSRLDEIDPAAYALPAGLGDRLITPALVIHLDRVRENLRRVIDHMGGETDRWRPHVKTAKVPAVYAELVRAGLRSFKCATTREAACLIEVLETAGGDGDVLVAHPVTGPGLVRLGELAAGRPGIALSVLAEDADAVAAVPAAVGVFVDVNPGMDRTGIPIDRIDAIAAAARAAGQRFRGVHCYEGHLRGMDPTARDERAVECFDRVTALLRELKRGGVTAGELVTSGTPTFPAALAYFKGRPGPRHRVSPGTVVYHDVNSEQEVPQLGLVPAAILVSRVVSRPADGLVTCDAGSKSIAAEAGDPCAVVIGRPELRALTPSEEHLPLRVTAGVAPRRGELLMLVPRHVCPTVNLAERAVLVEDGVLREIADVSARAHELLAGETVPAG